MNFLAKFSIIVAVGSNLSYLDKCVAECLKLSQVHELFVVPDEPLSFEHEDPRVRVLPSGKVGPGEKRDLAAKQATGDILAFIDDDAYPSAQWLAAAEKVFEDGSIAGVGGPAVTALEDDFSQRASGFVYSSFLGSGGYDFRYVPRPQRECDDIPTVNLLVRKSDFDAVGGFDTSFWPGEDTKLCLDIAHGNNRRLVYSPDALVYHHRRPLFVPHLRQVSNYALHRGFFVKKFPQTSLRPSYFLPSAALFCGLFLLMAGLFDPVALFILGFFLALHLGVSFAYGYSKEGPAMGAYVALGTLLTHAAYGAYFVAGLLIPSLKR